MYCPKCGTLNDERVMNCSRCGEVINPAGIQPGMMQNAPGMAPYPGQPIPAEIPNYMVQSVLVTLLCCMPLGIVGIFKANKVTKLIRQNDLAGALKASNENKTMLWIGAGAGFVITIFYIIASLNKS